MRQLIKNTDQEWVNKFFAKGQLLLRPFEYFALIADPQRIDDLEGRRAMRVRPSAPIMTNTNELWTPENITIRSTKPDAPAFFYVGEGGQIDFAEKLPNAYCYSVSEKRLIEYGDDAFVIREPERFLDELCRAIKMKGVGIENYRLTKVRYGEHKKTVTNQSEFKAATDSIRRSFSLDDYWLKPDKRHDGKDFKDELEWRFVYITKEQDHPLPDLLVENKELVVLCERHAR